MQQTSTLQAEIICFFKTLVLTRLHKVVTRKLYSKPLLIRINWRERSSGLMKQKIALKDKKKLRKQMNGTFNNISSADGKKKHSAISSSVRS
jgi:hypothetical protein